MKKQNNLQHIAIILDGNRRWATEKGMPKIAGHTKGAQNLKKIGLAGLKKNIAYLTVWGLSTENLKNRSREELAHLFDLFGKLVDYLDDFFKNGVRCNLIGDISGLPEKTRNKLLEVVERTKNNKKMTLTLALNYGGHDEIIRAFKKMTDAKIKSEDISEKTVQSFLDTADMPEVDLVIRTGGDSRLSGWLPWQTTYAELYFTKTYWPAFDERELDKAIDWFHNQTRNKGK